MQILGKCCRSCKFRKIKMRPFNLGERTMAWCKKHRENFELDSLCESYESEEIGEADNDT